MDVAIFPHVIASGKPGVSFLCQGTEFITWGFPEMRKTIPCFNCGCSLKEGFRRWKYFDYFIMGCKNCSPSDLKQFSMHNVACKK